MPATVSKASKLRRGAVAAPRPSEGATPRTKAGGKSPKTEGHWGVSGPGWAAEWIQGGESNFMSIACGADDDKAGEIAAAFRHGLNGVQSDSSTYSIRSTPNFAEASLTTNQYR